MENDEVIKRESIILEILESLNRINLFREKMNQLFGEMYINSKKLILQDRNSMENYSTDSSWKIQINQKENLQYFDVGNNFDKMVNENEVKFRKSISNYTEKSLFEKKTPQNNDLKSRLVYSITEYANEMNKLSKLLSDLEKNRF